MALSSCMWCGVQASCLTDIQSTQRRRPVSHGFYSMCVPKYHILHSEESIGRLKTTRWESSTCRVASCRSNDTQTSGSSENNTGVWTEFVAETLLPTNQGKFRLRGYRHTVRWCWPLNEWIGHCFYYAYIYVTRRNAG